MAGGIGSRFWPMSTPERPKQFIDVLGTGRTLLQMTVDRFATVCPPENIWVVTSRSYQDLVSEQIPQIDKSHILLEPCMRNTAPCIAYVAWKIRKKYPDANLVISPADHLVLNTAEFARVIKKGLEFTANEDHILTLGIKPSRPETGYGYIKRLSTSDTYLEEIYSVEGFREKPNLETAKEYLTAGGYSWNSGIFIWNIKTIEKAFRTYQPELADAFDGMSSSFYTETEQAVIDAEFPNCKAISIDYAVMEHAKNIYVFPADFGWSDLGTWGSLHELSVKDVNGNALVKGDKVSMVECKDCVVHVSGETKLVLQGLEGYIVAERDGVMLVCRKRDEQRIKEFSAAIKK